jgi:thioredoxin 1
VGGRDVGRDHRGGDDDFEERVLGSELPVLVDLWAPWCGPCHAIAPVVEEIARELAGRLRVAKLDVDENPETARTYGVLAIPTLILFRDGREVGRVVGARSKGSIVEALLGDLIRLPLEGSAGAQARGEPGIPRQS